MKIENATLTDALEIMHWFPDRASVEQWGSPMMRWPLQRDSYLEDIHWNRMPACAGRTAQGELAGFGQYYLKMGRCHLARLVVNPALRGQGLGQAFIGALMPHAARDLETRDFSLYVMRSNRAAFHCYRALGFRLHDYPADGPDFEDCVFMVAPGDDGISPPPG